MDVIVARLLSSFRDILASGNLDAEGSAGSADETIAEVAEVAKLFEGMFGFDCPLSMQPGLVLPDKVSVRWQHSHYVSGEVQISNLLSAMHSLLDPSLHDMVTTGHRLGDMRIADAVLVKAGPLHTLFEVVNNRLTEHIFLFDSRELIRIELSYNGYLQMAAATRGIVYWQYLFCDRRVTPTEHRVLSEELAFLESRFPASELDALKLRLRERS